MREWRDELRSQDGLDDAILLVVPLFVDRGRLVEAGTVGDDEAWVDLTTLDLLGEGPR